MSKLREAQAEVDEALNTIKERFSIAPFEQLLKKKGGVQVVPPEYSPVLRVANTVGMIFLESPCGPGGFGAGARFFNTSKAVSNMGVHLRKDRFPAGRLGLGPKPGGSALIFETGSVVLTGARTKHGVSVLIGRFRMAMRRNLSPEQFHIRGNGFMVINQVVSMFVRQGMDLAKLADASTHTSFTPSLFRAAFMKVPKHPNKNMPEGPVKAIMKHVPGVKRKNSSVLFTEAGKAVLAGLETRGQDPNREGFEKAFAVLVKQIAYRFRKSRPKTRPKRK